VLHLSHLATGGWLDEWARSDRNKKACEIESAALAPYMTLNGGLDHHLDGFSRKHRYNLKRARQQLEEKHRVRFAMFTGGAVDSIEENLEALFELHHSRKRDMRITSTFAGVTMKGFHKDLAVRFGRNGWLRMGSLKTEDNSIAVAYGFCYRDRFSYYQTGFDPDWERYGVGTTLLVQLIEYGYKEGWSEFDFLRGDEDYKYQWTDQERELSTVNIYNRTALGLVSRASVRAWNFTKRLAREW
jgi:CelD/BcsL family acetyltransferase involved in cellulose biosynthesis